MLVKCRICHNTAGNRRYLIREMMYGSKEPFHYFQCSQCDCLQIKTIPLDMARYYPAHYYSFKPDSNTSYSSIEKYIRKLNNRYAVFSSGLVGKYLSRKNPKLGLRSLCNLAVDKKWQILDVGCGSGSLLLALHELGFAKLLGIDPFLRKDIIYDNGVAILNKTIDEVDGSWNLIMFHHSFEHIADPANTLAKVSKLLMDGGVCLIRIPTVTSYAWKHYGIHWVQIDAPRHFFLHSVKSMMTLANQAGLHLANVIYDSTAFQFWGSEQYKNGISLKDPHSFGNNPSASIFSQKQIASFAKQAEKLNANNQGDQAVFYLVKC